MENRSPLLTKQQCFPTRSGQRTVTGTELLSLFDSLAPRFSVVVIDLEPILMLVISPTVEIRIIGIFQPPICHFIILMLRVQVSSIDFILTLSEDVD